MNIMEIFSEAPVNGHVAKNRIIRSATNDHLGNADGTVSDAEIEMYDSLGRGEVGTIITGHISVSPDLGFRADERQLCIGDDNYISGLSLIADKIHEYGSLAIAQLSHAGPRGLHPIDFNELTTDEMEHIGDLFVSGAVRAKKAGFDGVQIHIAHWYLLQAIINTDINRRTDRFGGSPENCIRLPREIVEKIREATGPEFIIMVKINAHNTSDGENDLEQLSDYCRILSDAGADLIEISGSDFSRKPRTDSLYYLEEAKYVKSTHPEIKLSLVGGIYSRETIEKALEVTEFASLSRALLTQPDFLVKMRAGELEKSRCLHCNKCFEIFKTKYERCVFGPVLPRLEESFGNR